MKLSALFAFSAIVLVGTWTASCAGNANLRLGPQGDILAWLVLGPLPNPGASETDCEGFENPLTGPDGDEANLAPVEGDVVVHHDGRSFVWRLASGNVDQGLDLLPLIRADRRAVAYAYASVTSPSARKARLLLGSDDGVKVWVNGVLVLTKHLTRGVKRDEDQVDIELEPGANRFMFKVDQHYGGWGLMARIVDPDGSPPRDLVEVLNVRPPVKTGWESLVISSIRAAGGKTGVLDINAAILYQAWRHKTDVWMPWFRTNTRRAEPYDQVLSQIAAKVEAAKSASPVTLSRTLADMADFLETQYGVEWKALDERLQDPKPLWEGAIPAEEDYIRVAPGGRYFVHADGTFFTPIGYNHNPDWTELGRCAPASPYYDLTTAERYIKGLSANGVNVLRMMIESPGGRAFLENPVGVFKAQQVAWIDNVVRLAGKYNIKLWITPWDTFWMGHRWDENPYNLKNGGLVDGKVDFITKPEVIEAQKKRWKYIIDRWGNTGTIFAWELLNETDLWWGASPQQVGAWAREMGEYVRQYEKQRWGRNHLICMSLSKPFPSDGWDEVAFRHPGMDLATTHLYIGSANNPSEPIGPGRDVAQGIRYSLDGIKDNRPYIDGEDGPINDWIEDQKLDDDVFHSMAWAHMSSGGAGSGFRWPYRNPHHISEGMLLHLSRMSRFAKDVPWDKLIGTRSEIKVDVPETWAACSTGTDRGGLVWAKSPAPTEMRLDITWLDAPKTVRYRCFDTYTGTWLVSGMATPEQGRFTLSITGCRQSVAVVLE